jgi:hypothetical protein
MWIRQLAKNIELGPRQYDLFVSAAELRAEQDRLTACVVSQVERQGEVPLGEMVRIAALILNWSESKVLQYLFWLGQELTIQFRRHSRAISAVAALSQLRTSAAPDSAIGLNRRVDDKVFQAVLVFLRQIDGTADSAGTSDQTELARRLIQRARQWRQTMETCLVVARRPGFPGERDIQAGLERIDRLLSRQEPYALLTTFHDHLAEIQALVQTTGILDRFFTHDAARWRKMVDLADASAATLGSCTDEPALVAARRRFLEILDLARPYGFVDEAEELWRELKPRHEAILAQQTEAHRQKALARLAEMIAAMKALLDRAAAPDDLRNQALYPLNTKITHIAKAVTVAAIAHHLHEARELFDELCEAVRAGGTP